MFSSFMNVSVFHKLEKYECKVQNLICLLFSKIKVLFVIRFYAALSNLSKTHLFAKVLMTLQHFYEKYIEMVMAVEINRKV